MTALRAALARAEARAEALQRALDRADGVIRAQRATIEDLGEAALRRAPDWEREAEQLASCAATGRLPLARRPGETDSAYLRRAERAAGWDSVDDVA